MSSCCPLDFNSIKFNVTTSCLMSQHSHQGALGCEIERVWSQPYSILPLHGWGWCCDLDFKGIKVATLKIEYRNFEGRLLGRRITSNVATFIGNVTTLGEKNSWLQHWSPKIATLRLSAYLPHHSPHLSLWKGFKSQVRT